MSGTRGRVTKGGFLAGSGSGVSVDSGNRVLSGSRGVVAASSVVTHTSGTGGGVMKSGVLAGSGSGATASTGGGVLPGSRGGDTMDEVTAGWAI